MRTHRFELVVLAWVSLIGCQDTEQHAQVLPVSSNATSAEYAADAATSGAGGVGSGGSGGTSANAAGSAAAAPTPDAVKVTIESGVLVGESAGGVNVFRGVPFAKPPVGELRWKAPQVPDHWPGERAAVAFEPPCAQPTNSDGKSANGGGVIGAASEDCLYLNVYAPSETAKAPIVVWLHGGAFFLGGGHLGSYNGTSNAKQGVITVSINYRLGSLGGFAHAALTKEAASDEALGSYALMDAVAALEWVQRNAAAFGGDPKNVTLAGQSAGGVAVMHLLSVPRAEGLFHKAIVQSGANTRPDATLPDAEQSGAETATALGLSGADATAEELRAVSAQSLVSAYGALRAAGTALKFISDRHPVQDDLDDRRAQRGNRARRSSDDRREQRRNRLGRCTNGREPSGRLRRRCLALPVCLCAGLPEHGVGKRRDPFCRVVVRVRFARRIQLGSERGWQDQRRRPRGREARKLLLGSVLQDGRAGEVLHLRRRLHLAGLHRCGGRRCSVRGRAKAGEVEDPPERAADDSQRSLNRCTHGYLPGGTRAALVLQSRLFGNGGSGHGPLAAAKSAKLPHCCGLGSGPPSARASIQRVIQARLKLMISSWFAAKSPQNLNEALVFEKSLVILSYAQAANGGKITASAKPCHNTTGAPLGSSFGRSASKRCFHFVDSALASQNCLS